MTANGKPVKKPLIKVRKAAGKPVTGTVVLRASGLTDRAKKLHELALQYHAQEQQQKKE